MKLLWFLLRSPNTRHDSVFGRSAVSSCPSRMQCLLKHTARFPSAAAGNDNFVVLCAYVYIRNSVTVTSGVQGLRSGFRPVPVLCRRCCLLTSDFSALASVTYYFWKMDSTWKKENMERIGGKTHICSMFRVIFASIAQRLQFDESRSIPSSQPARRRDVWAA